MTKDTSKILGLGDEALDAPMQNALPGCGFGPSCGGVPCLISDEALEAPIQEASTCAVSFVCACVGISDEALEAPEQHAVPVYNPPPCGPGRVCFVSDEALDAPVQQAGYCAYCAYCGPCSVSDETHATV